MIAMTRRPRAFDRLLDEDVHEAPDRLTDEDLFAESGPGWRRCGLPLFEMEDDR